MTKLLKTLLVVLTMVGFSQNVAQAKVGQLTLVVSGQLSTLDSEGSLQHRSPIWLAQSSGARISPSAALRAAKRVAPGSKGLGVRFLPRQRGYIVTLKTRGRIRRVFVDARTGRVGR